MDFKKNILTRVLAIICLTGWAVGLLGVYMPNSSPEGTLGAIYSYLFIILPASIVGFIQIIISATRWKKLPVLDKVIFVIILTGAFYSFLRISPFYFALSKLFWF